MFTFGTEIVKRGQVVRPLGSRLTGPRLTGLEISIMMTLTIIRLVMIIAINQ